MRLSAPNCMKMNNAAQSCIPQRVTSISSGNRDAQGCTETKTQLTPELTPKNCLRKKAQEILVAGKKTPSGEPIVQIFHWLKWADSDYLAARILLLGRLVVNGAALANTAIEKYLKALSVNLM